MIDMARLDTAEADFDARLAALQRIDDATDAETLATVQRILDDVRARGDAALVELTRRLDRREIDSMADLTVARERLRQ